MGMIQGQAKSPHFLAQDTLVGRSDRCTLRVDDDRVSRVHALLWWDDSAWIIKDLGSDNGTFVDGKALERGGRAQLSVGSELTFGLGAGSWCVLDVDPPVSAALCDGGSADVVTASGGLLALPSQDKPAPDGPRITLYRDVDGRWLLEGNAKPLTDGALLSAGEQTYRLSLPRPSLQTRPLDGFVGHSIGEVELRFVPSQDFEHIELHVSLLHDSAGKNFGAHKHNELLWALAEARTRDEEGWVEDRELLKLAGIESRERLNTEVYRARQQFAVLGLSNPAQIIERRLQTRKLRLGSVRSVVVERPPSMPPGA
jgi:hypothetical protein